MQTFHQRLARLNKGDVLYYQPIQPGGTISKTIFLGYDNHYLTINLNGRHLRVLPEDIIAIQRKR